jgi:hypothetical protein
MILEQIHEIGDPDDHKFPFGQAFFEDRLILYHGTWSTWHLLLNTTGLPKAVYPSIGEMSLLF